MPNFVIPSYFLRKGVKFSIPKSLIIILFELFFRIFPNKHCILILLYFRIFVFGVFSRIFTFKLLNFIFGSLLSM